MKFRAFDCKPKKYNTSVSTKTYVTCFITAERGRNMRYIDDEIDSKAAIHVPPQCRRINIYFCKSPESTIQKTDCDSKEIRRGK